MNDFIENDTVGEALDNMDRVMRFSPNSWDTTEQEAWLYAIMIGWSPTKMTALASKFGWDAETVDKLQRWRAAISAAKDSLRG